MQKMQPDWWRLKLFVRQIGTRGEHRRSEYRLSERSKPSEERHQGDVVQVDAKDCRSIALFIARRGARFRGSLLRRVPSDGLRLIALVAMAAASIGLYRFGRLCRRRHRRGDRFVRMMPAAAQHGVQSHDDGNGGGDNSAHKSPAQQHYAQFSLSARPSR